MSKCESETCGCRAVDEGLRGDKTRALGKYPEKGYYTIVRDTPASAENGQVGKADKEDDFTFAPQGLDFQLMADETLEKRATDAVSGGQKGVKQAQLGAVDPLALMELAKVAGFGAGKYARYNFLKGYPYSWSYDALQRHLNAFWSGEDTDSESKLMHLSHAMWHCAALISFQKRTLGTDDRPPKL